MPREIIEHQHDAQRGFHTAWGIAQPGFPTRASRALCFGGQCCSWVCLLDLGQYLAELFLEPGMQDGIGGRDDALSAQVAGGRTEQREQFGGASPLVLMRLQDRMTLWLPRRPRLRDRLI